MATYIARRVLLVPIVLLLLSMLVFWGIRAIPGDVVDLRLENSYTPERAQQLRKDLGLTDPIWRQYPSWLGRALRGNLGYSFITDRPVATELRERYPVTLELVLFSLAVPVLIGIPAGILAAMNQGGWLDRAILLVSILALAVPNFWVATLVLTIPSVLFHWSPPFGYTPFLDDPFRNLEQFAIPALIIGLFLTALLLRLTRAEMLEVLRQDYIVTARAKGLRSGAVVLRHALKNAMIPVITVLGLALASALSGAVIIEQIFSLPGLGSYGVDAVMRRDYTAIQAFTLFIGASYVGVNLLVDVSYSYLNPRIRYQ